MRIPDFHAKEIVRMPAEIRRLCRHAMVWFLVALPSAMQAQFAFTTNHGTLTISNYTGSSGTVVIPSATNGLPITAIGSYAFAQRNTVTNITIPGSITNIGPGAFYECGSLTNVSIGNGLLSLADSVLGNEGCFGVCFGLHSITLPASVTNVGSYAFWDCPGLTNLVFSGPTVRFGKYACAGAPLKILTIPNSTTNLSIGNNAFNYCSALTNIVIGSGLSVLNLGSDVFANSANLLAFEVDPANVSFVSSNGVLFDANQTILIAFPPAMGGSYVVPASVGSIADYAFEDCANLAGITLPNSLTNIGKFAFYQCTELNCITVPDGVPSIQTNTFGYCGSLTNAVLGNNITNIGGAAFAHCTNLAAVMLNSNLVTIGDDAFLNCWGLTNVVIPDSVTSLGNYAFESCFNATFTLGSGITNIGTDTFAGCSLLTNLVLPGKVVSIGDYAFQYCSGLTSVIIPASTTSIGYGAFGHLRQPHQHLF